MSVNEEIFSIPVTVGYPDCDQNNRMRLSAVMRAMQQTSSEHLEFLDLPGEKLFRERMVFLLTKVNVKIHRMPVCAEKLRVLTAPLQIKGVRFLREFRMDSAAGERLVSALTLWVLADPQTHKILRPTVFPYDLCLRKSIVDGEIGDEAIPKAVGGEQEWSTEFPVRYSHLDVNRHVNNSVYGDFVCDALPYKALCERELDTLALHFQQEARWGETVRVRTRALDRGGWLVQGIKGDTDCFAAYVTMK